MSFAHPALLSLLALAAAPAAIHWLVGRWAPVEPWAAMRFLTAVTPARRRSELRDRLVLAVRTLALALAALAAAGPRAVGWGNGAVGPAADDPPALHVVVLDDSLSTARPRGDGTAFAALRRAAFALAEAAAPADRFVLARTAQADPLTGPPRTLGPVGAAEFRRSVAAAESRPAAGDAPAALAAAAAALDAQADRFPAADVALLTDRAAADWDGPAVAAAVERLRAAGRGANPVRWLGPSGAGPPGRAIVLLAASAGDPDPRLDARPRVGAPAELTATVRSFGSRPAGAIAFFVNEQFVGRAPLPATAAEDLAPVETTATLPVRFEAAGPARVEARLEGEPGPPALASRFAVIPVRDRLRVAVAADPALGAAGPAGDPGFYLEQALAADAETFAVERIPFDALPTRDLTGFDAVALAGAPPPDAAAAVRAFLAGGGGAFVALRPTDDPADLRALFAGPLGGVTVGQTVGADDPTDADATGYTFEFEPNAGDGAGAELAARLSEVSGVRGGLIVGFRRLERESTPPAGAWSLRVLARFADESGNLVAPAVLTATGPAGGRAAVLATSADAAWGGPWPVAGASFVPLVRGLTAFAALPPVPAAVTTGAPLTAAFPAGRFAQAVRVQRPDGEERLAAVVDGVARFTQTGEPGFYRIGPESEEAPGAADAPGRWVAVNAPPAEADPRPALLPETAAPQTNTPTAIAEPQSLSAWMWAAALAALLLEPALARGRRPARPTTTAAPAARPTG
ncbi:BatA domain-containing protein [Alienimonas sp. DA493]|uniref:BatA domain-containing protein n=1 Tax=Alienimonas sp. DA493 TaxID=3373605 RepID=UPI003754B1D7